MYWNSKYCLTFSCDRCVKTRTAVTTHRDSTTDVQPCRVTDHGSSQTVEALRRRPLLHHHERERRASQARAGASMQPRSIAG